MRLPRYTEEEIRRIVEEFGNVEWKSVSEVEEFRNVEFVSVYIGNRRTIPRGRLRRGRRWRIRRRRRLFAASNKTI